MGKATCKAEGCEKPTRSRGMCAAHYMRWLRDNGRLTPPPPCKAPGCTSLGGSCGYCPKHYQRWKRTGDPLGPTSKWTKRLEPLPHGHTLTAEEMRIRHRSRMLITHEQFLAMAEAQDGRCKLCGLEPVNKGRGGRWLHIDHDHDTGQVRGLLCLPCNTTIGAAEKLGLERIARYLATA